MEKEANPRSIISLSTTWSDNQVLTAGALNGNFDDIVNDYNGNITNANISNSAAIATSKINATFPSGAIVGTTDSQTLTNKTLTTPVLSKPTVNASVQAFTTDGDGSTITFNMSASNVHSVQLGGSRTLAVSNVSTGQSFIIILQQSGSGNNTVTWFSNIKWPGANPPTLTTTANRYDIFTFIWDGTNYYGGIYGQNLG